MDCILPIIETCTLQSSGVYNKQRSNDKRFFLLKNTSFSIKSLLQKENEMYLVRDFLSKHGEGLALELIAGEKGLSKVIPTSEVQRPGIALSGYTKRYKFKRALVFGAIEVQFLKDLDGKTREERIKCVVSKYTPFVIVSGQLTPPEELVSICGRYRISLFCTRLSTMALVGRLTFLLKEDFAPTITCHGTFVEAFGVGVLIQGDSSVGKSEAALGLLDRGHRLVADDIVQVTLKEGSYLEGRGLELTRHLIEIRGIGIIDISHLYGAVCVRENKSLDLVVQLEQWNDHHLYDRVGLEEKTCDFLGIKLPFHVLPVKPGRDVVLLIETIVLNHRLKEMGHYSAKEFNRKLTEAIFQRQQKTRKMREKSYTKG